MVTHRAQLFFYRWQEQLLLNGAVALESKRRAERSQEQVHIEKLQSKIRQKDEVLAELLAECLPNNGVSFCGFDWLVIEKKKFCWKIVVTRKKAVVSPGAYSAAATA